MQEIDQRRAEITPDPNDTAQDAGVRGAGTYDEGGYQPDVFNADESEPRPLRWPSRRRVLTVVGVLLALVLLVTLPPLVNVNRFRRQIAGSVSASLGRPVRIDSVALTMLPMPGFTLHTFIVGEDPAFGAEPVIRADSVRLTLRWSSLWRRRVEFSRITLDDPSVNLVHLPDGRWNLETILLQAARMQAAPTGQKGSGVTPRFPYIEATGARVNVKEGVEKLPLSLTEAKFALWLPEPEQWRLRLEGKPTRTDASPKDTGLLQVEGTLGRAGTLGAVPVDLEGEWSAAPLGAASELLMGHDAGLRGEMTLSASLHGRVGDGAVETRLRVKHLRRSEFVPERTLTVDLSCAAEAAGLLHELRGVRCSWPSGAAESGLQLSGAVPDVFHPEGAQGRAVLRDVPVSSLLDGLRVASPRVSPELEAGGTLAGDVSCCANGLPSGSLAVTNARLVVGEAAPVVDGTVAGTFGSAGEFGEFTVGPVALALGGPAPATLEVVGSWGGYRMRLTGAVLRSRLEALAAAMPQFGDGLAEALGPVAGGVAAPEQPVRLDLQAVRAWGGAQTWSAVAPPVVPVKKRRGRR